LKSILRAESKDTHRPLAPERERSRNVGWGPTGGPPSPATPNASPVMRAALRMGLWGFVPLCLAGGCLYDENDRCSEGQRFNDTTGLCGCPSGEYVTEAGCIACGPNERFVVDSCQCRPGFERPSAGGQCESTEPEPDPDAGPVVPNGDGLACSSDTDCAGTTATFCDTFFDNICIVEDCDVANNTGCNDGETCCDLSDFGQDRQICSKYGCGP